MDPTAESPPGCLVLLLRLSAGMDAAAVTVHTPPDRAATLTAADAPGGGADELVESVVGRAAEGSVGPFDVAVLGYHPAESGEPRLVSLLPSGDPTPRFVPLGQV